MAKSERVGTFSLGYRSGQDRQSRDHDRQPLLRLHCGRRLELRRRTALGWATSTSSSSRWTRLSASLQFHPSEINLPINVSMRLRTLASLEWRTDRLSRSVGHQLQSLACSRRVGPMLDAPTIRLCGLPRRARLRRDIATLERSI